MLRDVAHAQAVSAVGADEQLVRRADHAGQHGLHAKGAAALHEDSRVRRLGYMREPQQTRADALGDGLVIVIPGAVVKQHLALDRIGRGQRPGGEQLVIVVHAFLLLLIHSYAKGRVPRPFAVGWLTCRTRSAPDAAGAGRRSVSRGRSWDRRTCSPHRSPRPRKARWDSRSAARRGRSQ